jgi:hypothetical protein
MNAALPLIIIKFKLRCVPFVQAAEKWWMQLLQLGQLIGDWKLQLYAQDQSILHERYHIIQQTRAKLLLFEIIFCVSHCFPRACQQEHRGGFPEVKTTKLPGSLY